MTQPATLSAPRTAPSTPPAASTPITSTDVESRSVRRLGRLWAPVDLLARAGWRTLRGARAGVGVSWATFRCRRRSVRSAASCSAGEGPPSEPDGKSAVGCWVAAVRSGAERPGLGSAEAAAAGFGVGVDFAGKLPSLRRASHRGCDPCDSRSACVRYAASPAAGGPKMPRLAAIVRRGRDNRCEFLNAGDRVSRVCWLSARSIAACCGLGACFGGGSKPRVCTPRLRPRPGS